MNKYELPLEITERGIKTKFINDSHEKFYNLAIKRTASQHDSERKALFYTLGLTEETRDNIRCLYNFEDNHIELAGLNEAWQTGTTIRVCRLAFNLYNGSCGQSDESEQPRNYTPYCIFDNRLALYMLEAIKIRYSDYCY